MKDIFRVWWMMAVGSFIYYLIFGDCLIDFITPVYWSGAMCVAIFIDKGLNKKITGDGGRILK